MTTAIAHIPEKQLQRNPVGHSCGRLDRLGGSSVELRTADHTSVVMLPGFRLCVICEGKTNDDGICPDPVCWDRLRSGRYPHIREVAS